MRRGLTESSAGTSRAPRRKRSPPSSIGGDRDLDRLPMLLPRPHPDVAGGRRPSCPGRLAGACAMAACRRSAHARLRSADDQRDEARMIPPPTSVRQVSGSPRTTVPSRTATTGFTYAYVPRARWGPPRVGARSEQHVGRVRDQGAATTSTRARARTRGETGTRGTRWPRRSQRRTTARMRPPAVICIPAATSGPLRLRRLA